MQRPCPSFVDVQRFPDLAGKKVLPLVVCHSAAGYYLGTEDEEGPVSRDSVEYWPTAQDAESALKSGDWTHHRTTL